MAEEKKPWISVKDSLPEDGAVVRIATIFCVKQIATYHANPPEWVSKGGYHYDDMAFRWIHSWQPL